MAHNYKGESVESNIDLSVIDWDSVFSEIRKYKHHKTPQEKIGAMAMNIVELKKRIKKLEEELQND